MLLIKNVMDVLQRNAEFNLFYVYVHTSVNGHKLMYMYIHRNYAS